MSIIDARTASARSFPQHRPPSTRPEDSVDGANGAYDIAGVWLVVKKPKRPRGRPRTTGTNPVIAVRWPQHVVAALERLARKQALDRGALLRQIVIKHLIAYGELKAEPEGATS
jgi:hypothetical protein